MLKALRRNPVEHGLKDHLRLCGNGEAWNLDNLGPVPVRSGGNRGSVYHRKIQLVNGGTIVWRNKSSLLHISIQIDA